MTSTAFAKINLGLHVLHRRADGYHELETVFLRIGWSDELSFEVDDELSMTVSDPSLPVDGSNLVIQAAQAMTALQEDDDYDDLDDDEDDPGPQGIRIHLEKRVPFGAGLGGGSADAAATLEACNELWDMGFDDDELMDIAADLGSDVSFFLGDPVAFGTSRGEELESLPFPEALEDTWMIIAKPPVMVSTQAAYQGVHASPEGRVDLRKLVSHGTLEEWRAALVNDFEKHILDEYPAIAGLKGQLMDSGAAFALMSGSGSSVFAVYEDEQTAKLASEALGEDIRFWMGRSDAAL